MTKSSENSVIIIGAGHNGLVCANYLSIAGYKVRVLEAQNVAGGGAVTSEFATGFKVSGLAHLFHGLDPQILKDIGLQSTDFELGPEVKTIALAANGNHLLIGKDSVTGEALSEEDKHAYKEFKQEYYGFAKALKPLLLNKPGRLKNMDRADKFTFAKVGWGLRFGLGVDAMREFLRVGGINIYDVLNEKIENPHLKGAISVDAVMGHHMGPRTPTTVLTYLTRLSGEVQGNLSVPKNGMGRVTELLVDSAKSKGVEIQCGTAVQKILVDEGKAIGVQLESGEQLKANLIVSNADAKSTFLKLIDICELDAMFAQRINTTRTHGNVAKFHFALDDLPEFAGLATTDLGNRMLIAPDMRYVEHAFNHAKYREFSTEPVIEITMPSVHDGSLAPSGHHVMSVLATFAPYDLKSGWSDQARQQFTDVVLKGIERYAPGITSKIIASELVTPVDIENKFKISGGHWHHGEMAIDQSFMMRPIHGTAQYNTPIEGLFLCGAAAHPGGGITGVPGRNAAKRISSLGRAG